ncbi:hypothetical protein K474DRAFT_71687 [Panus rudis PR-1116 ss-1]|nr:hypothetical protein K474DRAFT_71687 [Panus rudis PR-1116 ss-1]
MCSPIPSSVVVKKTSTLELYSARPNLVECALYLTVVITCASFVALIEARRMEENIILYSPSSP